MTVAKITDTTRLTSYPQYIVNRSTRQFVNKLPRNPVESLHMILQQKEAASLLLYSIWFPRNVWWARKHICVKL